MTDTYGCEHYKTTAKLLTPCCNKVYPCRFCHNDTQDHVVDTAKVRAILCFRCNTKQSISNKCIYCDVQFGEYACLKCKLFDANKNQYHCSECGICRIGPMHSYYHCKKCNLCLNIGLRNNHKCVENVSRDACAICTDDLHTSRDLLTVLVCGHLLHEKCYDALKDKLETQCPVCRVNMKKQVVDVDNPMMRQCLY